MRGRKPKTIEEKKRTGNPGKRRLNEQAPKPDLAMPECPPHLDFEARAEWNRVCPELMRMGVLARIDRAAIAAYCVSWSRWVEAEKQIRKFGPVIKAPSGYPVQNPHLGVANTAMTFMKSLLAEFGMTASSRTRLTVVDDPLPSDPLERLLELKSKRAGAKKP
jgi:P27 family predicted phage terminase small subunit